MPENTGTFSINGLSTRLGYDRRSLSKWLRDVQPAGTENGFPVFRLEDAQAAISRALQKTKRGSMARERLINLQAEKLAFQIAALKGEFVAVADVERDTAALVVQAKRVLEDGPRSLAPQVVGVSIPEAEKLLAEWVHDALSRLHRDPLGTVSAAPAPAPVSAPQFTVVTEH